MKIRQYLNENMSDDEIVNYIKKNCKPYLNDWKKSGTWKNEGSLFTGRNRNIKENIIIRNVRKDRQPLDTSDIKHHYYNLKFKERFDVNLRSESMFCTGSRYISSNYGRPFFIFPIGNYEIYWSQKISDMTLDMSLFYFSPDSDIFNVPVDSLSIEEMEDEMYISSGNESKNKNLIKKLNTEFDSYKKGDLKGAIESENEVMMDTKKVILVNIEEYYELIYNMIEEY